MACPRRIVVVYAPEFSFFRRGVCDCGLAGEFYGCCYECRCDVEPPFEGGLAMGFIISFSEIRGDALRIRVWRESDPYTEIECRCARREDRRYACDCVCRYLEPEIQEWLECGSRIEELTIVEEG